MKTRVFRFFSIVMAIILAAAGLPAQFAFAAPMQSPPAATLSLVEDITPGSAGTSTAGEVVLGNAVYFSLDDGSHGYELWKSDGTAAGTDIVKDIQVGANSGIPYNLTARGNLLLFQADDGTNGTEPWVSDGTEAGTHLIHDVNPGSNSSGLSGPALLGSDLIFAGSDAGNAPPDKGTELWKSSPPYTSAVLVKDINTGSDGVDGSYPDQLFPFNGAVYFRARDASLGEELWKTDGTSDGTVLVKDIRADGDSAVSDFAEFNGALFFQADDGINGAELWKSDGSTSGTQMLMDIFPGDDGNLPPNPHSSIPNFIASIGNTLFFTAFDGSHGNELWKTDGTLAGTGLVKDIRDGASSAFVNTDIPFFTVVNDQLLFLARDDTLGLELWKSDGTEAGTAPLTELNPSGDTEVYFSAEMNGLIYFVADIGDGMEIWQTDGTGNGTFSLTDINGAGGTIYGLYPVNGDLLFWYDDGSQGQELWKAIPPQVTATTITSDAPDPSKPNQAVSVSVTVNGSRVTPTGTVDISGADTNCQITLVGGAGSCTVNFSTPGKKTLTATYNGDAESLTSSDAETHQVTTTQTYNSSAPQDGWALESTELSGKGGTLNATASTLRLGDDAARKQFRSILSFNTSSLPDNAVITKVTLKVRRHSVLGGGNPVGMFQGFVVDIRKGVYGASALQAADFQATASKTLGPFNTALSGGWYSLNLSNGKAYINKLAVGGGLTQIRLRFKLDDNNNAAANFLNLYSGNAGGASSRPQLILEFHTP